MKKRRFLMAGQDSRAPYVPGVWSNTVFRIRFCNQKVRYNLFKCNLSFFQIKSVIETSSDRFNENCVYILHGRI